MDAKPKQKPPLWLALVWAAVCLALAAALLLLGGGRVVSLIAGPLDFSSVPPGQLEGQYVTLTVDTVLVEYAYSESAQSPGEVVSREFAAATPDGLRYLGVLVNRADVGTVAGLEALANEESAAPVRITGTLKPMDAETAALFDQALAYYEVSDNMALYEVLAVGEVGALSPGMTWLAAIAAAVLVIAAVVVLAMALRRRKVG